MGTAVGKEVAAMAVAEESPEAVKALAQEAKVVAKVVAWMVVVRVAATMAAEGTEAATAGTAEKAVRVVMKVDMEGVAKEAAPHQARLSKQTEEVMAMELVPPHSRSQRNHVQQAEKAQCGKTADKECRNPTTAARMPLR